MRSDHLHRDGGDSNACLFTLRKTGVVCPDLEVERLFFLSERNRGIRGGEDGAVLRGSEGRGVVLFRRNAGALSGPGACRAFGSHPVRRFRPSGDDPAPVGADPRDHEDEGRPLLGTGGHRTPSRPGRRNPLDAVHPPRKRNADTVRPVAPRRSDRPGAERRREHPGTRVPVTLRGVHSLRRSTGARPGSSPDSRSRAPTDAAAVRTRRSFPARRPAPLAERPANREETAVPYPCARPCRSDRC